MENELLNEIRRIISNRFYEHNHPFKRSSAGMEEFSHLPRIFDQLDDSLYLSCIGEIERLFGVVRCCNSCSIKLAIFLMVLCEKRFPDKFSFYEMKFRELQEQYDWDIPALKIRHTAPKRQFREEVLEAIQRWG